MTNQKPFTTFATVVSVGGYACGEAASALQKCIRRCDEDGALFWASELDISGYGEYVWKRLKIMCSEDIGLAEPALPATIQGLYAMWEHQKKKNDQKHFPERLFLVHAVLLMARAKKSRMVDNALCCYYAGKRPKREVPDVALDKHTARGRAMKRHWEHFFTEGVKIENQGLDDPYAERAKNIFISGENIKGQQELEI